MILRDAVHGDIELYNSEVKILDTPEVQRLRGVKQLGASSYIYPSATHSRFEHSLGTLFCAQKILTALSSKLEIDPKLKTIIRISALLHDITHIPFGHTFVKAWQDTTASAYPLQNFRCQNFSQHHAKPDVRRRSVAQAAIARPRAA